MPDTERLTLTDFVKREGIRMVSTPTDRNPCMDDRDLPMDHWRCVFMAGEVPDFRIMAVTYSQGKGHKGRDPKLTRVLDCLASDAVSVQNAGGSFEDWALELGMDPDSRHAERVYLTACFQTMHLLVFLGPEAFGDLLWNTDRE